MTLHICLVEPEIPHNTGAIARSCGLTQSVLHLVRPLGFSVDDKHLKRCGLDYWHLVDIRYHDSIEEVMEEYEDHRFFFASTKAQKRYADITFQDGDFLVFGKETKGLPESLLRSNEKNAIRIPMLKDFGRSLNLSVSVNIILFEALRQLDYPGMA